MSEGRNRLRGLLDTGLTVAAIVASLCAIAVVIVLLWWVPSPSTAPPQEAAVSARAPTRQQAAPAARDVAASGQHPAPAVEHVAAPVLATATTASIAAPPTRGPNDDAAKNRALGAALSRLGDDPELQRKLRAAANEAPP